MATPWRSHKLKKAAAHAADELRRADRVLRKYQDLLEPAQVQQLEAQIGRVLEACKGADIAGIRAGTQKLHEVGELLLPFWSRSVFREWIRTLVYALLIAMVIRVGILEAFKIPSASMVPTLLIGDHLIVIKLPYGLIIPWTDIKLVPMARPERGDIVVFRSHDPFTPGQNFIKRIVGVPGDKRIELQGNELYIDGKLCAKREVSREADGREDPRIPPTVRYYREDLLGVMHDVIYERRPPGNAVIEAKPFHGCGENNSLSEAYGYLIKEGEVARLTRDNCEIPDGYYFSVNHRVDGELRPALLYAPGGAIPSDYFFMMGDNRDNSRDSRAWGLVPFSSIKGKAVFIYWSLGRGEGGARQLLRIGDLVR